MWGPYVRDEAWVRLWGLEPETQDGNITTGKLGIVEEPGFPKISVLANICLLGEKDYFRLESI